jgi:hypothetical protein
VSALHVTNGDSAAGILREFLEDPVVTTADVLSEGPAPELDDEAWYEVRARYLAGEDESYEAIRRGLAASDRAIEQADELILWFEHDLFDQLLLVRTLDRIGRCRASRAGAPVSLICIDRFPGVPRFIGLGQLRAEQLSTLLPSKRAVTGEEIATASRVWTAFRAPDPTALAALASRSSSLALPFLGDALRRFLAEYPSVAQGLSRSALNALEILDRGPREGLSLFHESQHLEAAPFMGDWSFFTVVRTLAHARVPLVTIAPEGAPLDLRGHEVASTAAGRDVLAGRRDAVALNGIDEWKGGVHLTGANGSLWRWDAARETLVSWSTGS